MWKAEIIKGLQKKVKVLAPLTKDNLSPDTIKYHLINIAEYYITGNFKLNSPIILTVEHQDRKSRYLFQLKD